MQLGSEPPPPEERRMAATPGWVLELYPKLDRELPEDIVKELVDAYAASSKKQYRSHGISVYEDAINTTMDNFYCRHVLKREATDNELENFIGEIGNNSTQKPTSELMKNQTWKQFYDAVIQAVTQADMSIEAVRAIDKKARSEEKVETIKHLSNLYLFPAYIRLRKMGYHRYPDLV